MNEYGNDPEEDKIYRMWRNLNEWTTTPPAVAGWYWVNKLRVLDQTYWISIKWCAHWNNEKDDDIVVTHWLGPLPIPEPPKEKGNTE